MFQQILVKRSSAYWVSIYQKRISFMNCSIVIMSSLVIVLYLNFKSVINSHNKNMLKSKKKTSPCSCRDKTSCPLNGSCQYKNLVYSCKFSTADIKQNHCITLALQNIHLKIAIYKQITFYKHNNSFKYESKKELNITF